MRIDKHITKMFRLRILQLICVMGIVCLSVMGCGGGVLTKDIQDSLGIYRISIGNFLYGTGTTTDLTDFSVDVVAEGKTTLEIKIPKKNAKIDDFSDPADDFSNLEVRLYLSSVMEVIYPDENRQERRTSGGLAILNGAVFAESETRPVEIQVRGGNVAKTYRISIIREGDANAIPIYTEANFAYVRQNLNASYILKNDIALTKEFTPIGEGTNLFLGNFNGNDKTISNLTIAAPEENNTDIGMFRGIGGRGVVSNLDVVVLDGTKITGSGDVGILAGKNYGTIENVGVVGAVYLQGMGQQQSAGGLVGRSSGTITKSYARANVKGESDDVGGLVGSATASISGSHATGDVEGNNHVGGLVGSTTASISGSHATGTVKGRSNRVGGLVGYTTAIISSSHATGRVSGEQYVGGLAGEINVGLDGITKSYATGVVMGTDNVGGLVGNVAGGDIANSYATGMVIGSNRVGGLVGSTTASISGSHATGAVSGTTQVGGLVGFTTGFISNSHAMGAVEGRNNRVGGLVGNVAGGNIANNYATGMVTGSDNVGGLIGYADTDSKHVMINYNYASGNISGRNYVGGLVGLSIGDGGTGGIPRTMTINSNYATGRVSGEDHVGGLVGELRHDGGQALLQRSYATGRVEGSGARVGGLVGENDNGIIESSYFDAITTNQRDGIGSDNNIQQTSVTPYYTVNNAVRVQNDANADEVNQANAFGHSTNDQWDFARVWHWEGNGRWPTFIWQHTP